jgi:hypothetical protein
MSGGGATSPGRLSVVCFEPIFFSMTNDSLPLRKGDMLFVVAVVMLALALPTTAATAMVAGVAIMLWIRFRIYGGRNR